MRKKVGRNARVEVGDTIRVKSHWTDEWVEGIVRVPMSTQFSWTDKDGGWYYTTYDGEWEYREE